ncbi:MAG TPA: hypothetical protein VK192_03050, partial [Sphingomicrobium sp.]|nr:hypothetical protein [Sphingomicrobium sp.]
MVIARRFTSERLTGSGEDEAQRRSDDDRRQDKRQRYDAPIALKGIFHRLAPSASRALGAGAHPDSEEKVLNRRPGSAPNALQ